MFCTLEYGNGHVCNVCNVCCDTDKVHPEETNGFIENRKTVVQLGVKAIPKVYRAYLTWCQKFYFGFNSKVLYIYI